MVISVLMMQDAKDLGRLIELVNDLLVRNDS